MPNNCYNYLEAPEGDLSLIADYFSTAKRSYSPLPEVFLDFEKILPIPKELENTDPGEVGRGNPAIVVYDYIKLTGEAEDSLNWYDWCCENWGTKWNSYDGNVTDEGISFNTAWAPPIPVIAELAKQIGKPLRLIYDESGLDFCGEVLAQPDGTYVDNCYSPRSDAPAELKDDLMIDEEEELDNA